METVTSADGTQIAIEMVGTGRPVILIGGAFNDRSTVAALAAVLASQQAPQQAPQLAPQLTSQPTSQLAAVSYDRRGRGASGEIGAWTGASTMQREGTSALQREIEDLAAVIEAVGDPRGSAVDLFGHSSGAVLALEATQRGLPVRKVAVYEPSYVTDRSVTDCSATDCPATDCPATDDSRPRPTADLADRIAALAESGRRDEAVEVFLTEAAAIPPEMVAGMRTDSGLWGWFTGLAHTLPYDVGLAGPGMALPAERLAQIGVPVLAIGGGQSPDWLRASARAVADATPGARYVTLDGQDHGVLHQPHALLPLLTDFYLANQ